MKPPLLMPLYCKDCGYQTTVLSTAEAMPLCPECGAKRWKPLGMFRPATEDDLQGKVDDACSL